MKQFISVVVPAYNEEAYLEHCLNALASQTYPAERYEVVVVDNASTDSTAQIAAAWDARVITEPQKGVAQARQTGFLAARGSVIASTDADTTVSSDWVERIAGRFSTTPDLGGVFGPVYWPDGRPLERWALRYPVSWGLAASNRVGRSLWWGSNFAVQRDVFLAVGGFPTHFGSGEDTDLSLRVSRAALIRYDPALVVYSSNRRMEIGWGRYTYDTVAHVVQRFVLHRPPPPMMDIR